MIRKLLNQYIIENIKSKQDVALFFSGGMDSMSILLSLMDCNISPHLYSFMVDGVESSDIKICREVAKYFDLKYTEIVIPVGKDILINDVKYIIRHFNIYRKTAIQCVHPFIYIFPKVEEQYVFTGLCADDLYGTSKKMAIVSKDRSKFDKLRKEKLSDRTSSAYEYINQLANESQKTLLAPYKTYQPLIDYLLSLSYKEMNTPKQKNCTYLSFKEIFDTHHWYRRNENLQCSSKLREYHDLLLDTELNIHGNKVVTPIYKRIYDEISTQ